MPGYAKLFSSILTSSVWCEDHATVRVWVALLASADMDGVVEGSLPGFARLANVTLEELQVALSKFEGPDPYSRNKAFGGRRVETIDGGWRLLNYSGYREQGQGGDGSRAPYYRAYRRKKRDEARFAPEETGSDGEAA